MVAILLAAQIQSHAFRVVKDVNSGKPLEDALVIFDKGKPHDHLELVESETAKFTYLPDGSMQLRITGNKPVRAIIKWKAGTPGMPDSFDSKAYSALIITGKLLGQAKESQPNGKTMERRPDNLWFGPSLINAKGERVGLANMADVTEDNKTPAETTTMIFPMMLFYSMTESDTSTIQGVLWSWDGARANVDRDFTLVIEKISLSK